MLTSGTAVVRLATFRRPRAGKATSCGPSARCATLSRDSSRARRIRRARRRPPLTSRGHALADHAGAAGEHVGVRPGVKVVVAPNRSEANLSGHAALGLPGVPHHARKPHVRHLPIQILIVLVIALLVFGPKRLPEMGKSIGRGIREFKGRMHRRGADAPAPPPGRASRPSTPRRAPVADGRRRDADEVDERARGRSSPADAPPRRTERLTRRRAACPCTRSPAGRGAWAPTTSCSVVEHLDELRNRLIVSGVALVVAFAVAYAFHDQLIELLEQPLPERYQETGLITLSPDRALLHDAEGLLLGGDPRLAAGVALPALRVRDPGGGGPVAPQILAIVAARRGALRRRRGVRLLRRAAGGPAVPARASAATPSRRRCGPGEYFGFVTTPDAGPGLMFEVPVAMLAFARHGRGAARPLHARSGGSRSW